MQPRKYNRYPLDAPAMFFWKDDRDVRHQGIGLTRDISLGGAFVFTKAPPPLQVPIQVQVLLPALHREATPLLIQGDGRVTRVESGVPSGMRSGFAAVVRRFLLRNGEQAVTEHGTLGPRAAKKKEQ